MVAGNTWVPSYMDNMRTYFSNPAAYMYGRWDVPAANMEGGVDLASPGGTPVYAIADGPIIGAGPFWHSADLYTPNSGNPGYDVVTTRVMVPGYGLQDLYYQHIAMVSTITPCQNNCGNQYVHRGDLIGTVRANVGEIEMGFNANWGGVWGINHPGAWATDPRPMLTALLQEGVPPQLGGQPTADTSPGTNLVGATGTQMYLDFLEMLYAAATESGFFVRATLVSIGTLAMLAGVSKLAKE